MNTIIKTGLAAILLLAISCKKENNSIPSSQNADNTSTENSISDPGVQAVIIGSQEWMSANLNVSYYRNGDSIPQVKSKDDWATLTTGAWCWYKNDAATGAIYGKLYNWYAVNDPRGLAPIGWHIPSKAECDTLGTFLGGIFTAGGKMKETGTTHWLPPNADATNSSGFTGLPGGERSGYGNFGGLGEEGRWWSSSIDSDYGFTAFDYDLWYYTDDLYTYDNQPFRYGFSVRCVKDPDNGCSAPANLRVEKLSNTSAVLKWDTAGADILHVRVRYRAIGGTTWSIKNKQGDKPSVHLDGLTPNTTYQWQARSFCAEDTSGWMEGPDFTTTTAFAMSPDKASVGSINAGNVGVQVVPNPNKGNFTVQMRLPATATSTTLTLHNDLGQLVWQQNMGNISGAVQRTIALENKLPAGLYTLTIQRSDIKVNRKILINK